MLRQCATHPSRCIRRTATLAGRQQGRHDKLVLVVMVVVFRE